MKVVTFASAKGGVGKSTLAIGMAVAAMEAGETVYIIDTDPQQSVAAWASRRTADTPGVDSASPGGLTEAVAALKRAKFSLVVIDTHGADSGGTAAAMQVSDLVAVPVRPFAIDVLAVRPTQNAIERLGKQFCVILNAVQPRVSARIADATEVFNGKVTPSIVNRFAHADAIATGLAATEYEPEGNAAAELRELWAFIKGRLH
jgi:chromosome partitioning protein